MQHRFQQLASTVLPLHYLRENNTQEYSINLQTCSIISARTPHYLHLDTAFFSRTRAHRVFQKYQCRSVYTLNIRMLHPLSSLFKCHHGVVCRNVMSASFIPAIFVQELSAYLSLLDCFQCFLSRIMTNKSSRFIIICLISFLVLYKTLIFDRSIIYFCFIFIEKP